MSNRNRAARKIRPTPPGEMLRWPRAVSPEMALRLARLFGNTPEFWLNAQRAVDPRDAAQAIKAGVKRIKPLGVARLHSHHSPG